MTRQEEEDIIRSILEGNTDDFEILVKEYEKNVYNLALRMTGDPDDAYDMSQEAFVKAYSSLKSFRFESKFSVWLYRIVSNVCLDYMRSRKRRPAASLSVEDDEGEESQLDIPDDTASPESLLERKLTIEAVQRGLMSLGEEQRKILLMREIEGLSYEEIGEALALEGGTVKSRIFRARKKLCAFLISDGNIPDRYTSNSTVGGDKP